MDDRLRVTDNDAGEITVTVAGRELRGNSAPFSELAHFNRAHRKERRGVGMTFNIHQDAETK